MDGIDTSALARAGESGSNRQPDGEAPFIVGQKNATNLRQQNLEIESSQRKLNAEKSWSSIIAKNTDKNGVTNYNKVFADAAKDPNAQFDMGERINALQSNDANERSRENARAKIQSALLSSVGENPSDENIDHVRDLNNLIHPQDSASTNALADHVKGLPVDKRKGAIVSIINASHPGQSKGDNLENIFGNPVNIDDGRTVTNVNQNIDGSLSNKSNFSFGKQLPNGSTIPTVNIQNGQGGYSTVESPYYVKPEAAGIHTGENTSNKSSNFLGSYTPVAPSGQNPGGVDKNNIYSPPQLSGSSNSRTGNYFTPSTKDGDPNSAFANGAPAVSSQSQDNRQKADTPESISKSFFSKSNNSNSATNASYSPQQNTKQNTQQPSNQQQNTQQNNNQEQDKNSDIPFPTSRSYSDSGVGATISQGPNGSTVINSPSQDQANNYTAGQDLKNKYAEKTKNYNTNINASDQILNASSDIHNKGLDQSGIVGTVKKLVGKHTDQKYAEDIDILNKNGPAIASYGTSGNVPNTNSGLEVTKGFTPNADHTTAANIIITSRNAGQMMLDNGIYQTIQKARPNDIVSIESEMKKNADPNVLALNYLGRNYDPSDKDQAERISEYMKENFKTKTQLRAFAKNLNKMYTLQQHNHYQFGIDPNNFGFLNPYLGAN